MIFDPATIIQIPSPNHSPLVRRKRLITIHATDAHERSGSAAGVARNWFARKDSYVSADYITGPDEIVQCVPANRFAWHAGKCNPYSYGIEITGKAGQTGPAKDMPLTVVGEWMDKDSLAAIDNAAKLCAWLSSTQGIDVAMVTDEQLKALHAGDDTISGFAGHVDCSRAIGGNHWDPGPAFPWLQFMLAVRGYRELLESVA